MIKLLENSEDITYSINSYYKQIECSIIYQILVDYDLDLLKFSNGICWKSNGKYYIKVSAQAVCHKSDTFDVKTGMKIAYTKAELKAVGYVKRHIERAIKNHTKSLSILETDLKRFTKREASCCKYWKTISDNPDIKLTDFPDENN